MTKALKGGEVLDELWELPCRVCAGDRKVYQHGEHYRANDCGEIPCLNCRDSSGQSTGLRLPELSRKCDYRFGRSEHWQGCSCKGVGRVPLKDAERLIAGECLLTKLTDGIWRYAHLGQRHIYSAYRGYAWIVLTDTDFDRQVALDEALRTLIVQEE